MELHASYVQKRHYKPDYPKYSGGVITKTTQILYQEPVRNDWLDACIDISMVRYNVFKLTFTEKAALNLKDHILMKLPSINVELIQVSMIHSFTVKLLRKFNIL